ncbi:MAG TPA: PAS domain S-box protein, partial [Methanobacterium sp.]
MRGIVEVISDNDVRHITDNVVTAGFLGIKPDMMRNKMGSDLGEPKDILRRWIKHYKESEHIGKPVSFEYLDEREYGEAWLVATVNYIGSNSQGQPRYSYVVRDITEQKTAEHQLKESEEKYRNIVEIANEGIMIADTSGRINFVNAKMTEMLGYSSEELIGTDATTLVDKNEIEIGLQKIENRKKGIQESYEIKYIRKSGEELWCLISATPMYDYNGKHIGNMTMQTDITERKKATEALQESEERYHSLFDNNHAVMLLINPDNGDIIDANPAATHFYGYNYDELVKMNINNINVLSEEEIHDKMQKSVSSQQNNFLFKHQLASGELRDVDVYSGTIVLGGKKLLYSIVHDVTDRAIAQNKLEESNKELERFAYITSHDLREPLRMIISFLQLLERRYKDQLDEDANEFIGFAVDGAKRLDNMTNDLLSYSRITSEKREFKPVNFEHVLEHALENLKVQIEENNAIITHDPLPTINSDEKLKVQLFQNLIGNAIK